MSKNITVYQLKNWGRPKQKSKTPGFLLPKEEREKLLQCKKQVRGRRKK